MWKCRAHRRTIHTQAPRPQFATSTTWTQIHLRGSASARFTANGAWLVLAAIAFNLTRAAGALASTFHARATTATIRAQLITIPAGRHVRRGGSRYGTEQLALATRVAAVLHHSDRATRTRRSVIDPASPAPTKDHVEMPGTPADHSHSSSATTIRNINYVDANSSPWGAWGWEGPWGRGRGQRVVGRRVVEADMRGLVTAGPCVRLERCAGLRTSVAGFPLRGRGFGCS